MLLAHVFTFNIKHLFYPVPVILLLIYMSLVMVFFKKKFIKKFLFTQSTSGPQRQQVGDLE